MNILIIGNGFDIAHNLPTKYKDFLKVCRMIKSHIFKQLYYISKVNYTFYL